MYECFFECVFVCACFCVCVCILLCECMNVCTVYRVWALYILRKCISSLPPSLQQPNHSTFQSPYVLTFLWLDCIFSFYLCHHDPILLNHNILSIYSSKILYIIIMSPLVLSARAVKFSSFNLSSECISQFWHQPDSKPLDLLKLHTSFQVWGPHWGGIFDDWPNVCHIQGSQGFFVQVLEHHSEVC